jgi:hypothetical protein
LQNVVFYQKTFLFVFFSLSLRGRYYEWQSNDYTVVLKMAELKMTPKSPGGGR